jgi:hypothetical protein
MAGSMVRDRRMGVERKEEADRFDRGRAYSSNRLA